MPELPEVEIARRKLARWFRGHARRPRRGRRDRASSGARERERVRASSRPAAEAERRGKYLLLTFEQDQGALAHLGMTGKCVRRARGRARAVQPGALVPRGWRRHPLPRPADVRPDASRAPRPSCGRCRRSARSGGTRSTMASPRAARRRRSGRSQAGPQGRADGPGARRAGLGNIHAAEALFRARLTRRAARHPEPRRSGAPSRTPSAPRSGLALARTRTRGDRVRRGAGQREPVPDLRPRGRALPPLRHAHSASPKAGAPPISVPAASRSEGEKR